MRNVLDFIRFALSHAHFASVPKGGRFFLSLSAHGSMAKRTTTER